MSAKPGRDVGVRTGTEGGGKLGGRAPASLLAYSLTLLRGGGASWVMPSF